MLRSLIDTTPDNCLNNRNCSAFSSSKKPSPRSLSCLLTTEFNSPPQSNSLDNYDETESAVICEKLHSKVSKRDCKMTPLQCKNCKTTFYAQYSPGCTNNYCSKDCKSCAYLSLKNYH